MITFTTFYLSFTANGIAAISQMTGMRIGENYVIDIRHSDSDSRSFELSEKMKCMCISGLIKSLFEIDISESQAVELAKIDNSDMKSVAGRFSLQ